MPKSFKSVREIPQYVIFDLPVVLQLPLVPDLCGAADKLQKILSLDTVCICAQLMDILNSSDKYRALLALRGEEAQSLLDLIQAVRFFW